MKTLSTDGSKWHAFSIDKHSLDRGVGEKKKCVLGGLHAASAAPR